jgi:hypothetical protein
VREMAAREIEREKKERNGVKESKQKAQNDH